MNPFLTDLHTRAAARKASVIFAESGDIRVLQAALFLHTGGLCNVHLVGSGSSIQQKFVQQGFDFPPEITIHDISENGSQYLDSIADHLYERRKNKGMLRDQAVELCKEPLWYAAGLVALGIVDAGVAGAVHTTGDVLRAGLQMIGTAENSSVVSGSFIMSWDEGLVFAYADCAVFPYPNAEQLASIAADTARMYTLLTGDEARVAFLSFATGRSANHEKIELVHKALAQFKSDHPDLIADGPLQFDAALIPDIATRKAPGSTVAGRANVFIFPNLDAGNIAYKITERLGGAKATGPIIQGLAKPFNDLSRGASIDDIVDTACAAALLT